jgi:Domain of unknown function (DUF4926)
MSHDIRELDTVVLLRDLPDMGLRAGDLGAVVHVYDRAYEVEFVMTSGRTEALLTVDAADIRLIADDDVPAVRSTAPPRIAE